MLERVISILMYEQFNPSSSFSQEQQRWQMIVHDKKYFRIKVISAIDSLCFTILTLVSGYKNWCWLSIGNVATLITYRKYPIPALQYHLIYNILSIVAKSLFAFSHYRLFYVWLLFLGAIISSSLAIITSIHLIKINNELKNYSLDTVRAEISL